MVYVSSVGPVDPETGRVTSGEIRGQTRQCLANLRARLEEAGSSMDKVVWANWSLREAERVRRLLRGVAALRSPMRRRSGQGTLLPLAHRRAGFRVSRRGHRFAVGRRRQFVLGQNGCMADDLERFLDAQEPVYDRVLDEIRSGRKTSHWMWFIFPQVAGLDQSHVAALRHRIAR